MKSSALMLCCTLFFSFQIQAQMVGSIQTKPKETLPYYEIPAYPESYSCGNLLARMVDGLGYRYYWATEGLREEDLNYKPSEDSRPSGETLDHLLGLTTTIANAIKKEPNIRPTEEKKLTFEEKRKQTLENIKIASDLLKASEEGEVKDFQIIFQRGERRSEFPIWNLLNGPLADAMYHVGQIVAYRRASGNPMDSKVNVFTGKNRQ